MVKPWMRTLSVAPGAGHLARLINHLLIKVGGVKLVNSHEFGVSPLWVNRLMHFSYLMERVRTVEGDVVECGVGWGKSLAILALVLQGRTDTKDLWGFDSFEGLPASTKEDGGYELAVKGMFGEATMESAIANLRAVGIPEDYIRYRVELRRGWFEDTLPGFDRPIALLHIDADLYGSYITCLENLWDRVQPGGIIAFDEYQSPNWVGAKAAVDEFMAGKDFVLEQSPYTDNYYVVKGARP